MNVATPSNWDSRMSVPIVSWSEESPLETLPDHAAHLVETSSDPNRLTKRLLYEPVESKTLIVSLHGALNRGKYKLPRFEWRRTLGRLDAARLYLSDSTLELNNTIEIGWYIGTAQQDLISEYARIVQGVVIGGGYNRVLCVGSSAGGFAALALSRQIPDSVAVVFSPQTTIAGYNQMHRKALAGAAFKGYMAFDQIEAEFGSRVNMRKLYTASLDRNYVHFVQNTRDRFHFEAHYAPFALSFGVDPERGGLAVGRKASFHPLRLGEGHSPPSRGRFIEHVLQAHAQFYGTRIKLAGVDTNQDNELSKH